MAEEAFDTITEVQRMRDAGVPQAQAEAITLSIRAAVTGGVATKADLVELKYDLTWRLFGLVFAGIALSNGISFFLIRSLIQGVAQGQ